MYKTRFDHGGVLSIFALTYVIRKGVGRGWGVGWGCFILVT